MSIRGKEQESGVRSQESSTPRSPRTALHSLGVSAPSPPAPAQCYSRPLASIRGQEQESGVGSRESGVRSQESGVISPPLPLRTALHCFGVSGRSPPAPTQCYSRPLASIRGDKKTIRVRSRPFAVGERRGRNNNVSPPFWNCRNAANYATTRVPESQCKTEVQTLTQPPHLQAGGLCS